jgi:hypothetical protein
LSRALFALPRTPRPGSLIASTRLFEALNPPLSVTVSRKEML